jgi:hypothetical protein
MQSQEALATASAYVAIPMDRDGCSRDLHLAELIPESMVIRLTIQVRIAVIGNDGKNGTDAELLDQFPEVFPAVGRMGWTKIIEP